MYNLNQLCQVRRSALDALLARMPKNDTLVHEVTHQVMDDYLSFLPTWIVEGTAELGSDKTLWLEANAREQNGVSFTGLCGAHRASN